jgi:hypothetical protein
MRRVLEIPVLLFALALLLPSAAFAQAELEAAEPEAAEPEAAEPEAAEPEAAEPEAAEPEAAEPEAIPTSQPAEEPPAAAIEPAEPAAEDPEEAPAASIPAPTPPAPTRPAPAPAGERFEVGAIGAALFGGDHALFAGGAFVELPLIPHLLHLELAGLFGAAGDDLVTILDLVFKVPYRLSEAVELFGGLGLTVPVVAGEGRSEARPGLTVVGGAYYWLMPSYGAMAEGVFNLLSSAEGAHVEGGAIAGVAVRF